MKTTNAILLGVTAMTGIACKSNAPVQQGKPNLRHSESRNQDNEEKVRWRYRFDNPEYADMKAELSSWGSGMIPLWVWGLP